MVWLETQGNVDNAAHQTDSPPFIGEMFVDSTEQCLPGSINIPRTGSQWRHDIFYGRGKMYFKWGSGA